LLRLLKLAPGARQRLETGDLEMGHARALLSVSEALQEQLAQGVTEHQWSVRQTEQRVRQLLAEPKASKAPAPRPDPNIRKLEETLGQQIGAPVSIQHKASGQGSLVIRYGSLDELDGILKHIR
jgi:ParB family chromosome partitioning protein